jgi:hypothetical protein
MPIAFLALVALVAGLALAVAFTSLTKDDGTVSAATTAAAEPNEVGTASVPTAPPAAATSSASSPVPAP